MRKQGSVVQWNADEGLGLIRSPQTAAFIRFHLRDYKGPLPIQVGQPVEFEEIVVGGRGPQALQVKDKPADIYFKSDVKVATTMDELLPAGPRAARRTRPPSWLERWHPWPVLGLVGVWLLMWLVGIALGRFPWVVLVGLALLNVVALFAYWRDKHAAQNGDWRVQESVLHGFALLGGWPGAWFAQSVLRHKTRKPSFQLAFKATIALHCLALLAWLIWPPFSRLP